MTAQTPQLDLAAALRTKGLSQWKLAAATGIHPSTVSRIVAGLKPTDRQATLIAEALRARKGES
jgi:lambda repressor-like predicted transcriptional regulator